jgi:hypothetical protein
VIYRRGSIGVLLLLALVLFGAVLQFVGGPAAARRNPGAAATPAPHAALPAGASGVVRTLGAVERAFNAGDVRLLCRPGVLLDPAVVSRESARSGGCESELEALIADERPMRLAVRRVALRPELAVAAVTTARGTTVPVDLVRQGHRWLLSFSESEDPMPALAGAL